MVFYKEYEDESERIELYRLFARLFIKEPDVETLSALKDIFSMKFTEMPNELDHEFAHFFSGVSGHFLPYGSLYNYPMGDKPRLWGKTTEEVQAFYSSAGLMIDQQVDLIPDHLAAELLFMSYLIEAALKEYQRIFFEEHLLKWVPLYCDELQRRAETTFYREVADLLKELLLSDYEKLKGD
ncbi:MAG: molecular chaperone [Dissulfurispiraceae bacterium]